MISYLSGRLIEKGSNTVIIDVGGVGYETTISSATFYELGETGANISLRIYTYVREDTLQLFGFKTLKERALFLKLITVSGIGPKLAVTMLSEMGVDDIVRAIQTSNIAHLTSIPGVGRKTAERLLVELRDKLSDITIDEISEKAIGTTSNEELGNFDDALSALVNLGYKQNVASKVLKQAMREGGRMSVQKLLRRSLQLLTNS